jgi:hypothetical protein
LNYAENDKIDGLLKPLLDEDENDLKKNLHLFLGVFLDIITVPVRETLKLKLTATKKKPSLNIQNLYDDYKKKPFCYWLLI